MAGGTKPTPYSIPRFGGLDLNLEPDEGGSQSAIDLLNVDFDRRGAVRVRDGWEYVANPGSGDTLLGIAPMGLPGGWVAASASTVYSSEGSSHSSAGQNGPTFVTFQDPTTPTIFVFGATAVMNVRISDGAVNAGLSCGVADGLTGAVQPPDNRLVVVPKSGPLMRVQFSDPGDPATFGVNNFVDLIQGTGDTVYNLIAWRNQVFAFKQGSFAVFYGNSTDADGNPVFNYRMVEGHGTSHRQCAVAGPDGVYFLDREGVFKTTGGPAVKVSAALDPLFAGQSMPFFSQTTIPGLLGTAGDRLYAEASSGTYVYDIPTDRWTCWDPLRGPVVGIAPDAFSQELPYFPFGGVARMKPTLTTDNGAAIVSRYRSSFYSPIGSPSQECGVRFSTMDGTGAPSYSLSTDFHAVPLRAGGAKATVGLGAYRKQITVDHTKTGGTIEDFPVTVPVSADAGVIAHGRADFRDVRFRAADGAVLDHQLESPGGVQIAPAGGFCWFNGPRCVSYHGSHHRTFTGAVDMKTGDIGIGQLDHDSLASSWTVLKAGPLDRDDHDVPGIVFPGAGKALAFYSEHSVANTAIWMRKMTGSEDATAWDAEVTVVAANSLYGHAYPKPAYLSAETRIYLPYRSGLSLDQYIVWSDDGGATWTAPKILFSNRGGPGVQRPYFHVDDNGVDRIDFWCTDGHPRELPIGTSMHHFYLKGGNLYKSDGELISALASIPVTGLTKDDVTQVFDGTTERGKAWGQDIWRDNTTGEITALFTVYPPATPDSSVHEYWIARREVGGDWVTRKLRNSGSWLPLASDTTEPQYPGGMNLDRTLRNRLFASIETAHQSFNVERWDVDDDLTITAELAVTQGVHSQTKNIRPTCPKIVGAPGTAGPKVVYPRGRFSTFTSSDLAMFAWGGPITAAATLARVRVPEISGSVDTTFFMEYGDGRIKQQAIPYDDATLQHFDVTGHDFSGGTYFQSFDGFPAIGLSYAGTEGLTVEAEFLCTNDGLDGIVDNIFANWNGLNNAAGFLTRVRTTGNLDAFVTREADTNVGGAYDVGAALRDSAKHIMTAQYDPDGGLQVWRDGVLRATGTGTFTGGSVIDLTDTSAQIRLGDNPAAPGSRKFQGAIYRASVSNVARGAAWNVARGHDGVNLISVGSETALTANGRHSKSQKGRLFSYQLEGTTPWRVESIVQHITGIRSPGMKSIA